jgi:cyclophilin family peptidyl-prolyl cis-trans isomerase
MKKIACLVLATASATACLGMMTGCETDHPEVKIQLEFNEQTYTLEYELYRNIAPSTVNHFIWLVENNYYDGLCVHSYQEDSKMIMGGYTYSAEEEKNGGVTYKPYFEKVKGFKKGGKFPAKIWTDSEKKNQTYTLVGEFEDNQFTVKNGSVKESFGTLAMFYTTKDTDSTVYVKRADGKGLSSREYSHNSATTAFYMSLGTTTKTNKSYCTFATLKEDSVSVLEDLQQAITDYIEEKYDSNTEDFVTKTAMAIDAEDAYVGDQDRTTTYDVPKEPIIIKSVKVTKY